MFEIRKDGFYINNEPFRLFSGAMHYFRILPEYWEDRFKKMKACGFNGVETVMCWNLHEPEEGKFDFTGMLDLVKYCKIAEKYGMYVIVRPGPYTCGEWDFGGFPAWLLKDKNIRFRCDNEIFMSKVAAYYKEVARILRPQLITNGGNIIAMQVENEYGSYGNDKEYLQHIARLMKDNGLDVPYFTSDGNTSYMLSGGTLPDIYKTLNFGSHAMTAFNALKGIQDDMPKTCMEFWCGWFDHWGEMHHRRNPLQVAREVKALTDSGANINIYMFHGGTNFGFTAGANYAHKYQPTVTSYDDAALLNEYGEYTPAYHKVREILHEARGIAYEELPPSPKLQNIGRVNLDKIAPLWDSIYRLGKKHYNATPESMEYFLQNFGYILYEKTIKGRYPSQTLYIEGVHDIAYLKVNGQLVKKYDRTKNGRMKLADGFKYKLPAIDGECKIEILVEGMGRVNYGIHLENDRKGIQRVRLNNQIMFGWNIYTLPMDNLGEVDYSDGNAFISGKPCIMKGKFSAEKGKDCFVDTKGFGKGFIIVNGFNIGRYWRRGPQRTLYIPAPLLKENNEIIVFEQEGCKENAINIIDRHIL